MLVSIAIHLGVIFVLSLFVIREDAPNESGTTLIVDLHSGEAEIDVYQSEPQESAGPSAGEDSGSDVVPESEEARESTMTSDAAPAPAVKDGAVPPSEARAGPGEARSAAPPEASTETVPEPVAVATASPAHRETARELSEAQENPEQTIAQTVTVSKKQQKMLQRKFKKWTQTYTRMEESAPAITWKHRGQEYTAVFEPQPARNNMGIDEVVVRVSTEANGNRLMTEMRMKRLAFSSFAQFVNRWDPEVMLHDDELDGRFHSNSQINLGYSGRVRPVFHGKVTTSSRSIQVADGRGPLRRKQIFRGGLETGVRKIRLPLGFVPFDGIAAIPADHIQRFGEDTRITFHADSTYSWRAIESPAPEQTRKIHEGIAYLIGAHKTTLHVSGMVRGRVLVYSPERIVIEDDLVYAHPRGAGLDGDDYLGLVSDKYIEVAGPDVTGPGDLLIYASIYAKRRFKVKRFRAREQALLYIYGSLTAGSISATEPRYATRIEFDDRLENLRPPGFPMTDRYEIASWTGDWAVQ